MAGYHLDPDFSRHIIPHAEAARCLTMAGFTVLVWDHICTIDDEIQFWWTAPRSAVKYLFLVNRYITPISQAVAVYYTSRLVVFSDLSCRWVVMSIGVFETWSLATWDLLLIFRVHALWSGRRSVVIGTYVLYILAYCCHTVISLISAVQMTPNIHYDPLTKSCILAKRPLTMSIIWAFALTSEMVVFVLTLIKVLEHRASNQVNNPLMKSLHYGQIIYNVVIIAVRSFNLFIWITLPPSFVWLGVFFIWAMITALVTRLMLHLRKAANSSPQQSDPSFFAETAVSTRMVWARQRPTWNSSRTVFTHDANLGHTIDEEGGSGEGMVLRNLQDVGQPEDQGRK